MRAMVDRRKFAQGRTSNRNINPQPMRGIDVPHARGIVAANIASTCPHQGQARSASRRFRRRRPSNPRRRMTWLKVNAKPDLAKDGSYHSPASGQLSKAVAKINARMNASASPAPRKQLTPVMASPGMMDQSATPFVNDVSRAATAKAVMDEAGDASEFQDRQALGIIKLPHRDGGTQLWRSRIASNAVVHPGRARRRKPPRPSKRHHPGTRGDAANERRTGLHHARACAELIKNPTLDRTG